MRLAQKNGSGWTIQNLFTSTGNPTWSSLAYDQSNRPSVVLTDPVTAEVKYLGWLPLPPTAYIEIVDAAGSVGQNVSMTFGRNGTPLVSYYDATKQDLKFAYRNQGGWSTQTVDSIGNIGNVTSIEQTADGLIGIAYNNVTNAQVRYASAYLGPANANVAVNVAAGWDLISNPVTNPIPGDSVRQLFQASLNAYAFEYIPATGYVQKFRLENRKGYWEKFPAATVNTITGTARTRDTLNVVDGWNLVGSITNPVDTSTVVSIPPGLRASSWFGYSGGYSPVTQLTPGKGHWVKANGTGTFVIASPPLGGTAKPGASGGDAGALLNSLTITDDKGGSVTLYFGADADSAIPLGLYDMPPAPPGGAFDARFETSDGGSMVQTHPASVADGVEFRVSVQSDAYPLTIAWRVSKGMASYELTDGVGGRLFRSKQ